MDALSVTDEGQRGARSRASDLGLLVALDTLVGNDHALPGFAGTVCIGVCGLEDVSWWRASFAGRVDSGFVAQPAPTDDVVLLIGERDGGQQFPVDGAMDEVAIWNRALTNAEITTLFNGGAGELIDVPPDSFIVTTTVDENNGTPDPSQGAGTSLREALLAAETSTDSMMPARWA